MLNQDLDATEGSLQVSRLASLKSGAQGIYFSDKALALDYITSTTKEKNIK